MLAVAEVFIRDLWLEVALDSEWVAAYRLTVQDGDLIGAELRVFPSANRKGIPPGRQQGK